MEIDILNKFINNFDYAYILSINIVAYSLIKFVDTINRDKDVSILFKRILTLISIIICFITFSFMGYQDKIVLLNSSIAAPVIWSWFLRPIIVKFNIGYKQNNDNNKK